MNNAIDHRPELDIAIVGLSGRFPGARSIYEFWENLTRGKESVKFFEDQELASLGIPSSTYQAANFVKASPVLQDFDCFDAEFFGYSPNEANVLDPQHRVFLECAWEALEVAGYPPNQCPGLVGVFSGCSMSSYLLYNLLPRFGDPHSEDAFQVMIGNDKDFLSTRVSYKLNLQGPSLTVQTGCSTSLVATYLACQSLLSYQCDIALAGGVSIQVPARTGYFYQDGGLQSPDGHCRVFDATAQGTLFGSGVGIVVLKRYSDALSDRDRIHAIIKGIAVNNDGNRKVGFTAPSIIGQATVIRAAHEFAGIDPSSIGYVECHGTATPLGDPVEISALRNAFPADGSEASCVLGSVKSNIGHLDAGAGIAGLIKTVLALRDKQIPPTLHFVTPNPKLELQDSPFFVNTKLSPWTANATPRRAGVSSFGIGGTNAHVVLEEAPEPRTGRRSRAWQLMLLSAKTESALERQTDDLREFLVSHSEVDLPDAAYTTHIGRALFDWRRSIIFSQRDDLLSSLQGKNAQRTFTALRKQGTPSVVFMFPGGGAQYMQMGSDLYQNEESFRNTIDACATLLSREAEGDIRHHIYADATESSTSLLQKTSIGLPALFIVEYAMAQLLMSWGIEPRALIGHSLGEYVAACVAGVFTLQDALSLVVARSRLLQTLPPGAMLSVPLSRNDLEPWLKGGLSLAACNGLSQSVVSGPIAEIKHLMNLLDEEEIEYRRLHIDVASHCSLVESIQPQLLDFLQTIDLHPPKIPFVSNVTGEWITTEQATTPRYWADHLRSTVNFEAGLRQLLKLPSCIFVESGPGHNLATLGRSLLTENQEAVFLNSMRHPYERQADEAVLLSMLGKLWISGVQPDWPQFWAHEERYRHPLPGYSFDRKRCWIQPVKYRPAEAELGGSGCKTPVMDGWFYVPTWRQAIIGPGEPAKETSDSTYLVFGTDSELCHAVLHRLESQGSRLVVVRQANEYGRLGEQEYKVCAAEPCHYTRLLADLKDSGKLASQVLHFWSVTDDQDVMNKTDDAVMNGGYYSLLFLIQALGSMQLAVPIDIWLVGDCMFEVEGEDQSLPECAALGGLAKVACQEYPDLSCHLLDFNLTSPLFRVSQAADAVVRELAHQPSHPAVIYRGNRRWIQSYESCCLPRNQTLQGLRERGTYLITGGTGKIGLLLADYLSRTVRANLVLTCRTPFPDRKAWEKELEADSGDDSLKKVIRRLQDIERSGSQVMVLSADVADATRMREVAALARRHFGDIHGIVHLAAVTGERAVELIADIDKENAEAQFRPKVRGASVIKQMCADQEPDFIFLFSSIASVLGGPGLANYAAANAALDAFAQREMSVRKTRWISANWDGWLVPDDGRRELYRSGLDRSGLDAFAMTPEEGLEAFQRIMSSELDGQVIVSTGGLQQRIRHWIDERGAFDGEPEIANAIEQSQARPSLQSQYVPAKNRMEQAIAQVWRQVLRFEKVGMEDNFFDLGGTSLIALKLMSLLKKELKIDIPLVALFEAPTVRSLAQMLAREDREDEEKRYTESQDRGALRRQYHGMTEPEHSQPIGPIT